MKYRIGVDIGGTFTDFALINDVDGVLSIHKQLTTPEDPSRAVIEGIEALLRRDGVAPSEVQSVVHGSTLVTNAVIERRGAVTGMLVNKGFRDILDIANERRYDLYDLRCRYPQAIVPRELRAEIDARLHDDGSEIKALDPAEIEASVAALVERHGIQALAICFLHSFVNAEHERRAAEIVRRRFPKIYVSVSSEVFPFIREYERWTTTAINAFAQPMVDLYLANIERGLETLGLDASFYVMTSSGGVVDCDTARKFPVRMLESGPAAGVLMSTFHARSLGIRNLLSFDMGGTTAKGSIVRNGEPRKAYELEVARYHEFKPGSGLPVRIPVIDMIEIGAGGGGIAEIDERGLIRVGPRSAGARPGPACYGRGGTAATLTDANLVLGYYDAGFFLGGKMALDAPAAAAAIEANIGRPLDLNLTRAAWGIHEIINEDVARAFRVHASELGFDYRNCTMIAFGGSGPAHALRVARKLRIPRVVFPPASGVMSAIGMLVCPMSFQSARARRVAIAEIDAKRFAELFAPIDAEASRFLVDAGVPADRIRLRRALDMRYRGQGYEIEVPLPEDTTPEAAFESLHALFDRSYEQIFSLSYVEAPIEIVNWKVEALGPEPEFGARLGDGTAGAGGTKVKGARKAYFPEIGDYADVQVYDRYALVPGDTVVGPAFIEEREATFVVGVGDTVKVDGIGNLVAEIATGGSQ